MIKYLPDYPIAEKQPLELTKHEKTRIDNYYWLRARDQKKVIEYLNQENEYTQRVLQPIQELQESIFTEITSRIKQDDDSVPFKLRGYWYQKKFRKGEEYPIYQRRVDNSSAAFQIFLNANELAKGAEFFDLGSWEVSPNNKLLAFSTDTVGRRLYQIYIRSIQGNKTYLEIIPNTTGSIAWSNDNNYLFYTLRDPQTLRAFKVMRHRLGSPVEEDVPVFEETDETFYCEIGKTKSEKYLLIGSSQTLSDEYHILEADNPIGNFRLFHGRERKLEYRFDHFEDHFYIITNWEAENFRLMKCTEQETEKKNWQEVLPHRKDVLLEDLELFNNYMVVEERKNGIRQIRIRPWKGEEYYVNFPEEAYVAYTGINPEFDTPLLRLHYSSLTTPLTTFDYHLEDQEFTQLKQQEVLGGFQAADYQSERLYVKARDGVQVPVSIVYRKGFQKNGKAPLLLYAYGSYGHSIDPFFSSVRLSLFDRGFAFAIAHIRGGEELGRRWYEDGKLLKKKNTFFDFIDCATHLIENHFTSPEKLFAMGGSAGGLLMGAIINLRPDLWKGVVAAVPFVDVITTMLDETIPLTTFEYDEWGNPNDPEYYEYIASYSPYDNVEAKAYPNLLVTTGLHDSQVQYWEPAKWVAKLRDLKTDSKILLLHTNMEAGHGGTSGRFRRYRETAMEYAFLIALAAEDQE